MEITALLSLILATFTSFGQMAGIAAFISAVVNVLKQFGVVTDGNAGNWFAGLDLGAILVLVLVQVFAPQVGISIIDANAGVAAAITLLILGYLVSMGVGKMAHRLMSSLNIKMFGKSFSK